MTDFECSGCGYVFPAPVPDEVVRLIIDCPGCGEETEAERYLVEMRS